MGERMRSKDWAATPLGPVEFWPQSLRTSVSICLENSFPMLLMWGPDKLMLYNDGYRRLLGPGKHPRALCQPVLEIFPEIRDVIGPMMQSVVDTGKAVHADDMMLGLERQGYLEETYFFFSYSPVRDESGGVCGLLATTTETTQRVLGERRLRTLRLLAERAAHVQTVEHAMTEAAGAFDSADFPFALLYVLESEGRVARLVASSGLEAGSAIAAPMIELWSARDSLWPLQRVARHGESELVDELDSRFGWLPGGPWPEPTTQALVLPIAQPGLDHPYGFLVAGVSPRRALDDGYRSYFQLVAHHIATAVANAKAHQAQRERAEALAALDRAKTMFFCDVSHEFRTPLMLLLGPLDELLSGARGDLSVTMREELEAMQRNAGRLLKLVNTLLDFSRIQSGRAEAVYAAVDLATVTQQLASVLRSAIERGGLQLRIDCRPLPEPVYVDIEMWEKIVLNLLSNAFKFTFTGEIEISLQLEDDFVVMQVRDTGTGIPQHELSNLFKRFHRVRGAKSRSHEGTGIGLALVQDLVQLHGGTITVASEVGSGSCFRVMVRRGTSHLPADRIQAAHTRESTAVRATTVADEAMRWLPSSVESSAPAAEDVSKARSVAPSVLATTGARLLVVDDNADMRDYLRRVLSQHWNVVAVGDGAAALEQARRDPPELVLSDVMMPGLDGFALLQRLRADARTRHVPCVMLSARAGEEARVEGLDAGADDYLTKPFSARELVARVASQLVLARGRRALEEQRAMLYSHFMQAPTPICILRGPDHVIELANPRTCEVWGRKHEDVIGRPLFAALPETEPQGFRSILDRVLSTGERYIGKEVPTQLGIAHPRQTRYFNFVHEPMRDLRGRVDGVLIIAFDVTDEIRAREGLSRTVRYNELFMGILGHDLRNPLSAIMASAELIQFSQPGSAAIAESVDLIMSSSDRMSRMVEQLLDLTRIRLAGGLGIEQKCVDLAEILGRVLSEIQQGFPDWRVQLEIMGDTRGNWDPDRLAQVFSNLAGNAATHGSRAVPAHIYVDGREHSQLSVTFANQGAIPANLMPNLFDPLRSASQRRSKSGGLGLGLYIAHAIVTAHDGELKVTSNPEEGTRFRVVLPRTAGRSNSFEPPATMRVSAPLGR